MKKFICLLLPIMMAVAVFGGCGVSRKNDESISNYDKCDTKDNDLSSLRIEDPSLCIEKDSSSGNIYAVWALKTFVLSDATEIAYLESAICGQYAWIFNLRAKGITLYKLSASGKMEVYENIYPEDIGLTEMTFAFASFYNETNGCLFFWRDNCYSSGWPIQFLQTSDGGKSWKMSKPNNLLSSEDGKQYPEFAKFLTEDIGILSYRFDYSPSDCGKTYVTSDGGKTWENISDLPYPDGVVRDNTYSKLVDAYWDKYNNNMIIEVRVISEFIEYTVRFKSCNLKDWIPY